MFAAPISVEYVPDGHATHASISLVAPQIGSLGPPPKEPAGQGVHDWLPLPGAKDPGLQAGHSAAPKKGWSEYRPAVQGTHCAEELAPSPEPWVPRGHDMHVVEEFAPRAGDQEPEGQAAHPWTASGAPCSAPKVPGGQAMQPKAIESAMPAVAAVELPKVPRGQSSHRMVPC